MRIFAHANFYLGSPPTSAFPMSDLIYVLLCPTRLSGDCILSVGLRQYHNWLATRGTCSRILKSPVHAGILEYKPKRETSFCLTMREYSGGPFQCLDRLMPICLHLPDVDRPSEYSTGRLAIAPSEKKRVRKKWKNEKEKNKGLKWKQRLFIQCGEAAWFKSLECTAFITFFWQLMAELNSFNGKGKKSFRMIWGHAKLACQQRVRLVSHILILSCTNSHNQLNVRLPQVLKWSESRDS